MIKGQIFIKYRHFLSLLLYGLTGIIFAFCEKFITPKIIVYSRLDSYIPFIKQAVIPYLFWYVYIVAALLYLGFYSKIDFYRLVAFIVCGMAISIIIFILFPNAQNLRPVVKDNDFCSRIIKHIYSVDTPTNVTPSIHVVISIAIHFSLSNCELLRRRRIIRIISFICMVSISLSTVFIKQHSIIDVFWGAVVALALYMFIYKLSAAEAWEKYAESH